MSVSIKRTKPAPSSSLTRESIQHDTLSNLKSSLETIQRHSRADTSQIFTDSISLLLGLIGTALNKTTLDHVYEALVCQVGTTLLTSVMSLHRLFPDPDNLSEEDARYLNSLHPRFTSLERLIVNVASAVATSEHQRKSIWWTSKFDAEQCSRELRNWQEAFKFKISFFSTEQRTLTKASTQSGIDAYDLTWQDVEMPEPTQVWSKGNTFWDRTYQATVQGRSVVVKWYRSKSQGSFQRDLDEMMSHRHSNLPALYGYGTAGTSSAAFIVIAAESYLPFSDFISKLCRSSPESALLDAWKLFISIRETLEYLVRKEVCYDRADVDQTLDGAVVGRVLGPTSKLVLAPSHPELRPTAHSRRMASLRAFDVASAIQFFHSERFRFSDGPWTVQQSSQPEGHSNPRRDLFNFRPLTYAIIENPLEALHSSFSRLKPDSVKKTLARWRPPPERAQIRASQWPPSISISSNLREQPTAGDIGRFSSAPSGRPFFELFLNVQDVLGGHELFTETNYLSEPVKVQRIGRNLWQISNLEDSSSTVEVIRRIPPDLALAYLASKGAELARRFDTSPEDLVMVTDIYQTLRPARDFTGSGTMVYMTCDDQGHILRVSRGTSPNHDINHDISSVIDPTLELPHPAIHSVQIEEDEAIHTTNVEDGQPFYPPTSRSIGEVGYFAGDANGIRRFHAVADASPDVEVVVTPWEGNEFEHIGDRIWRSKPFSASQDQGLDVRYTWKATGTLYLPEDLQARYYHSRLLAAGAGPVHEDDWYTLVNEVTHQIHVKGPPPSGDPRSRVFVHFSELGAPQYAYWASADLPCAVPPPAFSDQIMISRGTSCQLSQEFWLSQLPEPVPLKQESPPGSHISLPKVGEVGYWVQDPKPSSERTDEWMPMHGLGVSLAKLFPIEIDLHATSDNPCIRASSRLWRTDPFYGKPSPQTASYTWSQDIITKPVTSSHDISSILAEDLGAHPREYLIVTRVTTQVRVTIAPTLGFGAGRRPIHLFIYFPQEGGCQLYWSLQRHNLISPKALSRIDMEAYARVLECDAQITPQVERIPLAEFAARYSKRSTQSETLEKDLPKTVVGKVPPPTVTGSSKTEGGTPKPGPPAKGVPPGRGGRLRDKKQVKLNISTASPEGWSKFPGSYLNRLGDPSET